MAGKEVNQTVEEKQQEQNEFKAKEQALGDKLLASLDLENFGGGKQGGKVVDGQVEKTIPGKKVELVDEEPTEEESEEAPEEKAEEKAEETEEEASEEDDADVIPASKVKKMQERMEKRINSILAENRELKARQEVAATPESARKQKLESMSVEELKVLKRDVMREFKKADDPERESQLLDLQDEVDHMIVSAPQRFELKQISHYNKVVEEIVTNESYQDIDFDKEAQTIKALATKIYNSYPELKGLEKGQAIALKQAMDHYVEVRKLAQGKDKTKSGEDVLKRKINTLKRKTGLGSSTSTGQRRTVDAEDWKRAKESHSIYDKEAALGKLINIDAYLPEGFKNR